MSVRKNLSSVVVFSSVFLGSIISEGINIITTPNSIKDLFKKMQGTIDVVRESIKEKTDDATILLIESSTVAITRTKMKMENLSSVVSRYKSKPVKANSQANSQAYIHKLNQKLNQNLNISIPKPHVIDIVDDKTEVQKIETKPKVRKKRTIASKTDSTTSTKSTIVEKPIEPKTIKPKTVKSETTKSKTTKSDTSVKKDTVKKDTVIKTKK